MYLGVAPLGKPVGYRRAYAPTRLRAYVFVCRYSHGATRILGLRGNDIDLWNGYELS